MVKSFFSSNPLLTMTAPHEQINRCVRRPRPMPSISSPSTFAPAAKTAARSAVSTASKSNPACFATSRTSRLTSASCSMAICAVFFPLALLSTFQYPEPLGQNLIFLAKGHKPPIRLHIPPGLLQLLCRGNPLTDRLTLHAGGQDIIGTKPRGLFPCAGSTLEILLVDGPPAHRPDCPHLPQDRFSSCLDGFGGIHGASYCSPLPTIIWRKTRVNPINPLP